MYRSDRCLQCFFPIDDILLYSRDIYDQVTGCLKSSKNSDVFVFLFHLLFGREGVPKYLTQFYKCGSALNMWQYLVTNGQATSLIRQQITLVLRRLGKKQPQQNIMACAIISAVTVSLTRKGIGPLKITLHLF